MVVVAMSVLEHIVQREHSNLHVRSKIVFMYMLYVEMGNLSCFSSRLKRRFFHTSNVEIGLLFVAIQFVSTFG